MDRPVDVRSPMRVIAVGFGVVLGSIFRNAPIAIADVVVAGGAGDECGADSAIDCAFANTPRAIGELVRFGLIVLLIAGVLAIFGVLAIVYGLRRTAAMRTAGPGDAGGRSSGVDLIGTGAASVGVALAVPAICLAATILAALVS